MNEQEVLNAHYRTDLVAFAERAMVVLEPSTKLVVNWHHHAISHQLMEAYRGEIRRLIINQPPKTLKTHLVSISFVAWLLMHDPSHKICIISYDEVLASKILRSVRQILKDPWYRKLAPDVLIKAEKDTEHEFETTAGGECRALTVFGAITGHGFDYIIIDDPMKASNAHSETERHRLEEAYSSAIANRWRSPAKGVLILVMQRLHIADFTMYLLKANKTAVHLCIPAVAATTISYLIGRTETHTFKEGELFEPERLSADVLDELRELQGSANFEAQYLQTPQHTAGRIIKPEWIQTYLEPRKPDYTVISIDPAFTKDGGDYSAAIVVGLVNKDVEIIHAEQAQFDYPGLLQWIRRLDKAWKPDLFLVEAIGAGLALPHYLREEYIKHLSYVETHLGKSKIERMEMVSPLIEAGRLWVPLTAPWRASFLKDLLEFPYGVSDDWPDAVSQLLLYLDKVRRWAEFWQYERRPKPVCEVRQPFSNGGLLESRVNGKIWI